jgi:3',5'-cyclic AMP phosphodiesterase CpdA
MDKKNFFLTVLTVMFSCSLLHAQQSRTKLRFAFATDVHMNKDYTRDRLNGFKQALTAIKEADVDFIIFGGDLNDVSGMSQTLDKQTAENLYAVFKQTVDETKIKYYPTIGNHDRYFDNAAGYPEGDEMFKACLGKSYDTFEKAGIRFFILNSVQHKKDSSGYFIGDEQMEWLKKELTSLPVSTPVVLSTHVPVYSMYYPVVQGKYTAKDVIVNCRELLGVFANHNLKLVLQGHMHLHEEMLLQGVHYITGGAVSGGWWRGAHHGTEEGFLLVEVDANNRFSWRYVDYGWTAK